MPRNLNEDLPEGAIYHVIVHPDKEYQCWAIVYGVGSGSISIADLIRHAARSADPASVKRI